MKPNHKGPALQTLLHTKIEEHFGDRLLTVYELDLDAKAGRIHLDWERLLFTLDLIETQFSDPGNIKILELGANPYFLTEMIQARFGSEIYATGCRLGVTADGEEIQSGYVSFKRPTEAENRTVENRLFNVEEDSYPYDDSTFDLVICQELIEHLLFSPTFMLNEIHRVLKKRGKLLLSCPNAVRIDVLRKVFANKNPTWGYVRVVDQLGKQNSGWPAPNALYGRHNREYTLAEAVDLVQGCGFQILKSDCVTFQLPKVQLSFGRPSLFLRTFLYRSMKSATFLPLKFLQMKKDFVFIVAEKNTDSPIEYYPPNLYDVWQVQKDEATVTYNDR